MRRILSVSVALALILIAVQGPIYPQQKKEEAPFTFSVQSQLVEVYLTVTKGKELVPNLIQSDFSLKEDGMAVTVDRLDNQEVPLQIVLLIDLSESIRPSLKTIQQAAIAFLDNLKPKDRVTLILFNSDIKIIQQETERRDAIIQEIKRAQARGITKLHDSLILGMKYLDGKQGRKALVCFTDGQDTSGTTSGTAAINAAVRFGFPIYMIGVGAGLELDSPKILLKQFADANGGKAFFLQSVSKLRDAFNRVAEELRSAYVLNYYTKVSQDGRWHNLSVNTVNSSYTVHFRKGFFAHTE